MAISTSNLYIESDNLWKVTGLVDKSDESSIDNATIIASVMDDTALSLVAAFSDLGGGEVNIEITAHDMTSNDYVRLIGSINYDGEHQITVVDVDNIKITATYVAEAAYADIEVYHCISASAYQISIPYVAASTGDYQGTLPDTLPLINENWYNVFTDITATGTKLLVKKRLQAIFAG